MTRDSFDKFHDRDDRGRFGDNESASSSHRPRVTGASDLTDIDCVIYHGTPKALLVSLDGNPAKAVWLPRSLIEIEHKQQLHKGLDRDGRYVEFGTCVVTLPTRFAKEKGLV